ncbi:MAG: LamG-like jellyroll fold domain-containing protein [Labilithrix sp.]
MRRRGTVVAAAVAIAACGLDVIGVAPVAFDGGADAATSTSSGGSTSGAPLGPEEAGVRNDGGDERDTGACVSPDSFCDTCDPTLVLCLRFNGLVDESRYHRKIDVSGLTKIVTTNGRTVFLAEGTADITLPTGPPPDPLSEVTIEVVARTNPAPSTVRYGLVDREGPGDIAFFLGIDGSLRCGSAASVSPPNTDDGGLAHRACVRALGRSESFLRGQRVGSFDGGDPALTPAAEAFSLLSNSPNGDPFLGEVRSIRIYSRAKTAEELAAAARDVTP